MLIKPDSSQLNNTHLVLEIMFVQEVAMYVAMCICPPAPFMCKYPMKQVLQVATFTSYVYVTLAITKQNYHLL